MLVPLEKAIQNSNLELNPMVEGQVIRINLPELTSERRAELAKSVKSLAEESKISLRNIRQEAMSNLKRSSKDENIPEDEVKEIALTNKNVARHLENKNIIKIIFIKNKLINFVHS